MLFSTAGGLLEIVQSFLVGVNLGFTSLELIGDHVLGSRNACLKLSDQVVGLVQQGILFDQFLSLASELVLESQDPRPHAKRVLVIVVVSGSGPCSAAS